MAEYRYSRLIFIGRFQPLHQGHVTIIEQALQCARRLSVLIGSAHQPRSLRNPWFEHERQAMFTAALPASLLERIDFGVVDDVLYDDEVWRAKVMAAVAEHQDAGDGAVGITGHDKDASSYYLKIFPQWPYEAVPNYRFLSSTPMRERLFAAGPATASAVLHADLADAVPRGVVDWLEAFIASEEFAPLCAEYQYIKAYRKSWAGSPYAPVFVTVDALVQHRNAVLLVRRGSPPGLGQLAMPGGFVEPDERLAVAALRELSEETGLGLSAADVEQFGARVYDHPDRSARGRFFSHVFHYRLTDEAPRPTVVAGDDARQALWCDLDTLDSREMFEDHYCIIQHLLDRYSRTTHG